MASATPLFSDDELLNMLASIDQTRQPSAGSEGVSMQLCVVSAAASPLGS